jgi:hypothetical protein
MTSPAMTHSANCAVPNLANEKVGDLSVDGKHSSSKVSPGPSEDEVDDEHSISEELSG